MVRPVAVGGSGNAEYRMSSVTLAASFVGLDTQTWFSIAIGSFITLIIALIVYRKQKSPKTLDYAIRSTQDLTGDASPHLRARMEVIWKEDPNSVRTLKEPRIVNYHIRNTGKRAIAAADFESAIKVDAPRGSIVDIIVTGMSHTGILELGSVPAAGQSNATFTPRLMNPGDWIDIQLITDGCSGSPALTCWIREESRPMRKRQALLDPSLVELSKRAWRSRSDEYVAIIVAAIAALATILSAIVAAIGLR